MKPDNSSDVSCTALAFRQRRSDMKALLTDQPPQIRQFLEDSGLATIATAEVNRLLVTLLPGVVHEINNPVGFVTANLFHHGRVYGKHR